MAGSIGKGRKKAFAVFTVIAMMLCSFTVIMDSGSSDADTWVPNGTNEYYSYTLRYDASKMSETAQQEYQLSVEGMTPISHAPGTTTLSSVANEGSWGFDRTTGIGPFNSFYGAFDMTQGNKFFAVLDPYNLTQTIDGVALDPIANYNIMWVLPTVYWSTDESGNVTLTNDPSGGTAYAHTIDGKVREYVAYGVYIGSTKTIDDKTVLTSQSGVTPTHKQTREVFREQAHNYTMDQDLYASDGTPAYGMLWNFYQWTLYKLIAYTIMEGFNSQMLVGNGNVNGGNINMATGLTDTIGPYAGNPGDLGASGSNATTYGRNAVKLFIENAWGTLNEFVDGVVVNGRNGFYIDTSSTPTDSTTAGGNVEYIAQTIPSSNYGSAISTNTQIWGIPTSTSSYSDYYNKGTTDMFITDTTSSILSVGGGSAPNDSLSANFGLSYVYTARLSWSDDYFGTRLAFVYGEAFATITAGSSDTTQGTVSPASIRVLPGSSITISGNTLTIGSETITATPTTGYKLAGWFNGDTQITDGDTVTGDMTITARFVEREPITVVFDTDGGNSLESIQIEAGDAIGELPTPTRTNYTFVGWFLNGEEVTAETVINSDSDSITLVAQWELDASLKPVYAVMDIIPILMVVGLLLGVVGAIFKTYSSGGTISMRELIAIIIGASVCVLLIAAFALPVMQLP